MKYLFPKLTGTALIGAGIASMHYGKTGAKLYGLASADDQALVLLRAAGVRNIALGISVLSAPSHGRRLLLACTLVSLLDFGNVAITENDPPLSSLSLHGIGTIILAAFAFATPRISSSGE